MTASRSPALPIDQRILDLLADGKARTPQEIAHGLVADPHGDYIALRDRTREVGDILPSLRQREAVRRLQYPVRTDPGQKPFYIERYVLRDSFDPVCLSCWDNYWGPTVDPAIASGNPIDVCSMCGKRTHDGAFAAKVAISERKRSLDRRRVPIEESYAETDRESGLRDLLERYLREDPLRAPDREEITPEELENDSRRMANDLAGVYQEAFDAELSELQRLREMEKILAGKLDSLQTKYDADAAHWRADRDRLSDFIRGLGIEPEGQQGDYRWTLVDVLTGGTFITGCAAPDCPTPNEPHRHFCPRHRDVLLDYLKLDKQAERVISALEWMGSRMKIETEPGLYDAILRLRSARKTV